MLNKKIKFIAGLACIDFGIFLSLVAALDKRFMYNNFFDQVLTFYQIDMVGPFFTALLIATIGIYLLVDTFYNWSQKK